MGSAYQMLVITTQRSSECRRCFGDSKLLYPSSLVVDTTNTFDTKMKTITDEGLISKTARTIETQLEILEGYEETKWEEIVLDYDSPNDV